MATKRDKGTIAATLIPGDGIGPEISEAVVAILDALGGGKASTKQFSQAVVKRLK